MDGEKVQWKFISWDHFHQALAWWQLPRIQAESRIQAVSSKNWGSATIRLRYLEYSSFWTRWDSCCSLGFCCLGRLPKLSTWKHRVATDLGSFALWQPSQFIEQCQMDAGHYTKPVRNLHRRCLTRQQVLHPQEEAPESQSRKLRAMNFSNNQI